MCATACIAARMLLACLCIACAWHVGVVHDHVGSDDGGAAIQSAVLVRAAPMSKRFQTFSLWNKAMVVIMISWLILLAFLVVRPRHVCVLSMILWEWISILAFSLFMTPLACVKTPSVAKRKASGGGQGGKLLLVVRQRLRNRILVGSPRVPWLHAMVPWCRTMDAAALLLAPRHRT